MMLMMMMMVMRMSQSEKVMMAKRVGGGIGVAERIVLWLRPRLLDGNIHPANNITRQYSSGQ